MIKLTHWQLFKLHRHRRQLLVLRADVGNAKARAARLKADKATSCLSDAWSALNDELDNMTIEGNPKLKGKADGD